MKVNDLCPFYNSMKFSFITFYLLQMFIKDFDIVSLEFQQLGMVRKQLR